MRFNALIPEFSVRNIATSVAFYVEFIGFEIAYERPEDGFTFLALGEAQLMLDQIGTGRDFTVVSDQESLGKGMNLQLFVDRATQDEILSRLRTADIVLAVPLEERWYRIGAMEVCNRQFVVADPDGYLLRVASQAGERSF